MPRKRKNRRYGDYCEEIKGVLYGSINIPIGNGKYKKKRKKVQNVTEARQWALAELERLRYGSGDEKSFKTFTDLAEWYKTYFLHAPVFEKDRKVDGIKDWKRSKEKLTRIAAFFAAKRLANFTETDLRAYILERRNKDKVSTATINRDLALIRAMFRKAHAVNENIRVPKFPINRAAEVERDRVMSIDEEKRLLAACESVESLEYVKNGKKVQSKHRTNREHLKAIIIVAVDTAMRVGEILSLTWDDIDLEKGQITLKAGNTKTQRSRTVGITPRMRAILETPGKGKVFNFRSIRKSFATACDRAEIKDLHFHDLRHTATTRMIRAGIPHAEVMKVTGHTQIKTFLRYLNLDSTTVQNAANMLAKYLEELP